MGVVLLEKLIELASKENSSVALDGRSKYGREFSKVAKEIVVGVPTAAGVYCWGQVRNGQWCGIYVGQSVNLRKRLLEELTTEREFLWAHLPAEIEAVGSRAYGDQWERKYRHNAKRSVKKNGSTHIKWALASPPISGDTEAFLEAVEHLLIESLCPTANHAPITPQSRKAASAIGEFFAANE
jgi:hypothetical protein